VSVPGPRIGLVLHPRADCSPAVARVARWTSTHGVELVASTDDVARLSGPGVVAVDPAELATTTDGLIALGGDGTLLGAMRLVADRPVPVLGVNFGRIGFLTEVESRDLETALEAMAEGRASTESRSCLEVTIVGARHLAFNDAVLARVPGAGLVEATMSVAGQRYGHYTCDALILATPMGSTAYNYAAGGPVVSPSAAGVLVTPSAPLNGIARSVLLGPAEQLQLELTSGSPALELDGVLAGRLEPGAVVEARLRLDAGRLVRIEGSRAAARSRVKLSLLDLPVLPQELLELLPEQLRERLGSGEGQASAARPHDDPPS
jgi:NAD+ kinase